MNPAPVSLTGSRQRTWISKEGRLTFDPKRKLARSATATIDSSNAGSTSAFPWRLRHWHWQENRARLYADPVHPGSLILPRYNVTTTQHESGKPEWENLRQGSDDETFNREISAEGSSVTRQWLSGKSRLIGTLRKSPFAMPVDDQVTGTSRWSVLREVKTPLTFFALAIFIVEGILFSVAQRADG